MAVRSPYQVLWIPAFAGMTGSGWGGIGLYNDRVGFKPALTKSQPVILQYNDVEPLAG